MPSPEITHSLPLYPFRFEPVYKHYLWGGTRFRELFKRSIDPFENCTAESWEIADHPQGTSVLLNGPLRGLTLRNIIQSYPKALFGHNIVKTPPVCFPLILKYLDAAQPLSVQVHPDAKLVEELKLQDREKNEFWIVVDAKPGASLWAGTNGEYSTKELEQQIQAGTLEKVLNRIKVKPGDCFYLPAGTIHALGKGILVAEVQTASDLTFRLFDWNRVDVNGKPRKLDLEHGLRAVHLPTQPISAEIPFKTQFRFCERLTDNAWFSAERWTLNEAFMWANDDRCHLWTVLEGSVDAAFTAGRRIMPSADIGRLADPDGIETLHQGCTLMIPASCPRVLWVPERHKNAILLDVAVKKC